MANVEMTWVEPTPESWESAVDHYAFEISYDDGATFSADGTAPAGSTSYVFSNVTPGNVQVSIQSVDDQGDRSARVIRSVTAAEILPPVPLTVAAQNV